jgi:hypothetical protein
MVVAALFQRTEGLPGEAELPLAALDLWAARRGQPRPASSSTRSARLPIGGSYGPRQVLKQTRTVPTGRSRRASSLTAAALSNQ